MVYTSVAAENGTKSSQDIILTSNWFHNTYTSLLPSVFVCELVDNWQHSLLPSIPTAQHRTKPTREESDVPRTAHRKWFHFHFAVRLLLNPYRISAINISSRFSEAGDHMGADDVAVFLLRKRASHGNSSHIFSHERDVTDRWQLYDPNKTIDADLRQWNIAILRNRRRRVIQEDSHTGYCSSRNCFYYCPRWCYGLHTVLWHVLIVASTADLLGRTLMGCSVSQGDYVFVKFQNWVL